MSELPTLLKNILSELQETLTDIETGDTDRLKQFILNANRVFVTGKGRSGLVMQGFAMRLMHLGMSVFFAGDVTTPAIGSGDLLLIGSGSGRTPSLVQHAKRAHDVNASIGLITIAPNSPIAEAADTVVLLKAPSPKVEDFETASASIMPMGTRFELSMAIFLDALIVDLMHTTDVTADDMFSRHTNLE